MALLAVGCHGNVDGGYQDMPEDFTGPFTLSVDKEELPASGTDWATFSLKDAYGREILDEKSNMQYVNIYEVNGNASVARLSRQFRAIVDDTFTFEATYKGEKSANAVDLVTVDRVKYEKYHKNVALYKATGTWCGPCGNLAESMKKISEDTKDHLVQLSFHGDGQGADDPYSLPHPDYFDYGNYLTAIYGSRYNMSLGFPTIVLDAKQVVVSSSASDIDAAVYELRANYPATCGLKVSSEYDEATNTISVEATLASDKGGSYDVGFALLLNNEKYTEGTVADGVYSHIVRGISGNFFHYAKLNEVAAGEEKQYTMDISPSNGESFASKISNMEVAVFAIVPDGDYARVDNITVAPVGETQGYTLN